MTDIWIEGFDLIMSGMMYTLLISLSSIILGSIIGVGFCAMKMSGSKILNYITKYSILVLRGVPALVLLMFIFHIALPEHHPIIVAISAFSINFGLHAADIFFSGIKSVNPSQRMAGLSLGFTKFQIFRYIIFPQAARNILPIFKFQMGSLVKGTSVVGYIAIIDLTNAINLIGGKSGDVFMPYIIVGVFYCLIGWCLGQILDMLIKNL